jgi:hypothetical protein
VRSEIALTEAPRIGRRILALVLRNSYSGEPMSDDFEKWDAFDYLTVAGAALFLGGLGSAVFRATRRGALLFPAALACMAIAAYGARLASSESRSPAD